MKKQIEMFIKGLIYASFFVPLIVIPSSFIFPFIVPKILAFRTITELMMCAYALLLVINWREYRPKFTALNLALGAFLLSFALSTFIGVDPYHSFWDNHERMLGLFTIAHFVAYYFICTAVFKTWSDWKWVLRMFLIGGSIVMFIGVLQAWVNPSLLLNNGAATRVASSLGNAIYVGGYGLFLSFVAVLLFLRENNPVWRWVYAILGIFGVLGLFYSGTRGSMLGFVAGAGVAMIGYIIALKEYKKTRLALIGLAIAGVILISLFYIFRQTAFVRNLPAVGRTVNTSLSDIERSPRWIAWQIAIESWKDRPIFGWGPNNFFYAFNAHYNPKSLNFGYGETWFDNAHNIIVNTLAVQGAFGLIIYLAVFVVGIISLVIAWKNNQLNYHIAIIGSAFLVAHLVGNVTVFENPTSYLYFMFWLALINSVSATPVILSAAKDLHCHPEPCLSAGRRSEGSNRVIPAKAGIHGGDKPISSGLVIGAGVFALLLIFIFNIQPARANMQTLDAIRYLSQDPVLGVSYTKTALAFNSPHIDDIRADIGRTATQMLSGSADKLGKERSQEIFEIVYPELQKNLILHPLDIRNQITLSQMAQIGYQITNNGKYIMEAQTMLEDALVKSPRRQQIIYSLSALKMQLNQAPEAVKLLEQTIADNPNIGESYWRLAYAYKFLNQADKIDEVLALAEKNSVIFTDAEKNIIAQIKTMPAK
ncbi:MAG: O-antigen ligase family protein [Candidatus Magasanikbacteria bacterium]